MKTVWAVLGALALSMGSADAEILMDAGTRNGSFTNVWVGGAFWFHPPPGTAPTGWSVIGSPSYRLLNGVANGGAASAVRVQLIDGVLGAYNTGLPVDPTRIYKITADLNTFSNLVANVWVYGTENADGSGNAIELTRLSYLGTQTVRTDVWWLNTVTATGGDTRSADGYYLQVRFGTTENATPPIENEGDDSYVANIVVEDISVPIEFTSVALADTWAMELSSISGRVYALEYSTDLVASSEWQNAGMQLIGTGSDMYFFDPAEPTGTSTSRVYRILVP